MAKLHVTDEAHLFRIVIEGRFAGEPVERVRQCWNTVMTEGSMRRFTVDISQLTGYDHAGCRLLREMYNHGCYLSARTPRALVFLNEVAGPELTGPTLIYKAPEPEPKRREPAAETVRPKTRAAASGE